MVYGCTVAYNKQTLKQFCEGTSNDFLKGFNLFANLDEFKLYGKFGNANILHPKDWEKVKEDPSYAKLGTSVWSEETGSCRVYSSVLVKVIYDNLGFSENLQTYVKDVIKYAVIEEWTYPPSSQDPAREVDFN